MRAETKYTEISQDQVPAGVRFDVPRHLQGQIIEVAYGGFSRWEHGPGDLYKRVTDRSDRSVSYYKRDR